MPCKSRLRYSATPSSYESTSPAETFSATGRSRGSVTRDAIMSRESIENGADLFDVSADLKGERRTSHIERRTSNGRWKLKECRLSNARKHQDDVPFRCPMFDVRRASFMNKRINGRVRLLS